MNGGVGGSPTLSTLQLSQDFAQISSNLTIPSTNAGLYTKIPEIRLTGVRIDPQAQGGLFGRILKAVQTSGALLTTQNTLPAAGTIRLCAFVGCTGTTTPITAMLTQTSGTASTRVGIGVGGAPIAITNTGTNPYTALLQGTPWTVNTATVMYRTPSSNLTTLTAMGFVSGPLSNTGTTLSPTSDPMSGTVQLVTPVQITTTGLGARHDTAGLIVRLTLHFQPEPGRALLLAAGAAALALLGLRRR